jgi:hypothetical protein
MGWCSSLFNGRGTIAGFAVSYLAPLSIHALISPICSGVSGGMLPLFLGGGMKSSGSPKWATF